MNSVIIFVHESISMTDMAKAMASAGVVQIVDTKTVVVTEGDERVRLDQADDIGVYYDVEELEPVRNYLGNFRAVTAEYRSIPLVKKVIKAAVVSWPSFVDNDCGTMTSGPDFIGLLSADLDWDWRVGQPAEAEPTAHVTDLLPADLLPDGFVYPTNFLRIFELGLVNLEPWWITSGSRLRTRYDGLKQRYPDRVLVPFARREDNDDVACWDAKAHQVFVIHDFANPGYESRETYENFIAWFRQAVEDLIAFE